MQSIFLPTWVCIIFILLASILSGWEMALNDKSYYFAQQPYQLSIQKRTHIKYKDIHATSGLFTIGWAVVICISVEAGALSKIFFTVIIALVFIFTILGGLWLIPKYLDKVCKADYEDRGRNSIMFELERVLKNSSIKFDIDSSDMTEIIATASKRKLSEIEGLVADIIIARDANASLRCLAGKGNE